MATEKNKFSTRIKKKPMPESNTIPKKETVKKSAVKEKTEKEITKRLTIDIPHTCLLYTSPSPRDS